jgi:hypothetical protein
MVLILTAIVLSVSSCTGCGSDVTAGRQTDDVGINLWQSPELGGSVLFHITRL